MLRFVFMHFAVVFFPCTKLEKSAKHFLFGCSSPHLVQVRERIRINGQPIGKELFTKYFWQVYGRLDETKVGHVARQISVVVTEHGYLFTSVSEMIQQINL